MEPAGSERAAPDESGERQPSTPCGAVGLEGLEPLKSVAGLAYLVPCPVEGVAHHFAEVSVIIYQEDPCHAAS